MNAFQGMAADPAGQGLIRFLPGQSHLDFIFSGFKQVGVI
jgi:hypothetical protein